LSAALKSQVLLHFVVIIFGFTAILRRLIDLPSMHIVWYRMTIAFLGLLVFMLLSRHVFKSSWSARLSFLGIGVIVAAHWLFFFEGIELANSSTCLAGLASTTLFVALFEPLVFKRSLSYVELILSALVIGGLLCISWELPDGHIVGFLMGILAAILAALFSTINGKLIRKHNANEITLWEMLGGALAVTVYFSIRGTWSEDFFSLTGEQWMWMLVLGLVATSFAYVASVYILKSLTPFTVSLAINLEPVYGMALAVLLFEDEKMSPGFYAGTAIILATIIGNVFYKRHQRRKGLQQESTPEP